MKPPHYYPCRLDAKSSRESAATTARFLAHHSASYEATEQAAQPAPQQISISLQANYYPVKVSVERDPRASLIDCPPPPVRLVCR